MNPHPIHGTDPGPSPVDAPDRGSSFVEVLVAVVLLGTIVVATLTGLRAAVVGSSVDENSARAYAWLQAAGDEVYFAPYLDCDTNSAAAIESAYQTAVDGATRPTGWGGAVIDVSSVQFLSRNGADEQWGATCATGDPDSPLYAQLVTIVVSDPDGDFTATVEVIKSV